MGGITTAVESLWRPPSSAIRSAVGSLVVLLVAGCAMTPADPGEAIRKALAPTGKLRTGLISVPVHSIRNPYSGELRGVSHDLGRAFAARLGVAFKPIVYPNPAAYVAAGRAGASCPQWTVCSPMRNGGDGRPPDSVFRLHGAAPCA